MPATNDSWNASTALARPLSSGSAPVSRMPWSRPAWRVDTHSWSSRSKRRTSVTGMSSSAPDVPAYTDTTCSSTGIGEFSGCLSSSTRR